MRVRPPAKPARRPRVTCGDEAGDESSRDGDDRNVNGSPGWCARVLHREERVRAHGAHQHPGDEALGARIRRRLGVRGGTRGQAFHALQADIK